MTEWAHEALCKLAVEWLKRPDSRKGPGCQVAVSETQNYTSKEIPDAIGWRAQGPSQTHSVVVEVKVSRADFLADAKKPHRKNPESGMGAFRYYMAPAGLIKPEELPPKWGLLEVSPKGLIKVRAGHVLEHRTGREDWVHQPHNVGAEMSTLILVLARVGDPQKFQDMLREANRQNARLMKHNVQLQEELYEHRRGLHTPRRA